MAKQEGYQYQIVGEVAEWLNAPHSKCGIRATVSGVRIPPSPLQLNTATPRHSLETTY
jgi:hypothetical protein